MVASIRFRWRATTRPNGYLSLRAYTGGAGSGVYKAVPMHLVESLSPSLFRL
jgi:hypothetical protein